MPAARAGLRVNDQITHIDGSELFNLPKEKVDSVFLFKGIFKLFVKESIA